MHNRIARASLLVAMVIGVWNFCQESSAAGGHHKRTISYQNKNDLFYNAYVGPNPSGTAAQMYVSPQPVPAHVGHTYITSQPLMPHEYMYHHSRSHYVYNHGAGWTRAKIRYKTSGLRLQDVMHRLSHRY